MGSFPEQFAYPNFAPCNVIQDSVGFWISLCGLGTPCQWNLDSEFTPIVSEIPDSLSWITSSKSQES